MKRHQRLIFLATFAFACESDPDAGKVPGYTYCAGDWDCPSGQVCETDDTRDAYCTPTCSEDDMCPTQVGCPSLSPVGKRCYFEPGFEGIERGECDQFQGYYGPNSCQAAPEAGDDDDGGDDGGHSGCTANSDCGQCERCELSTGNCVTRLAC